MPVLIKQSKEADEGEDELKEGCLQVSATPRAHQDVTRMFAEADRLLTLPSNPMRRSGLHKRDPKSRSAHSL